MNILEVFCAVDDFWQEYKATWERQLLASGRQRQRRSALSMSEVMTIMILFHQSGYRHFKGFYTEYVCQHLQAEFPQLVSYNRFIELQQRAFVPLAVYLQSRCGQTRGIAYVDSLPLAVCHNRRIPQHRVFEGIAQRGKNSMGWFYGFKVHLVINDQGELLAFAITPGNVDDRQPVRGLVHHLKGKLFGDKGYLSASLVADLLEHGLEFITSLRKNMPKPLLSAADRLFLRKRALIESVNDQLKNISQIEHSRHRSVANFFINLLAALIAYTHQPKKPALRFEPNTLALLSA